MRLSPAIVTLATFLTPAIAAACPASNGGGSASCALSGYVLALGIGLLAGMGSVGAEKLLRKR